MFKKKLINLICIFVPIKSIRKKLRQCINMKSKCKKKEYVSPYNINNLDLSPNIQIKEYDNIAIIKTKSSSSILKDIIKNSNNLPIFLKIDIEGLEYDCFDDLQKENLIKNVDLIMLKWLYKGYKHITNILESLYGLMKCLILKPVLLEL